MGGRPTPGRPQRGAVAWASAVIATREGDRTRSHPRSRRRFAPRGFLITLGLSLLPLLVSAVTLVVDVGRSYVPDRADYAYTELLTRDVGHHPVLTGLYSRTDWNHPGPALFSSSRSPTG